MVVRSSFVTNSSSSSFVALEIDSKEIAEVLAKKLDGIAAHVNLIPLNNIEESPLKPSTRQAVQTFQKILEDGGIPATVRRTLGGDIDASCGQLRRNYTKETKQTVVKE